MEKLFFLIITLTFLTGCSSPNINSNNLNILNINENSDEQVSSEASNTISNTENSINKSNVYKVVNVVDGDTIDVEMGGGKERLRLIGIDTPETVDPRKPVQCFGKEASDKAKELLLGKMVSLEADPTQGERDKYDRLLRYVFLEDGTFFNKEMIEQGYAHEYTYDTPYKYQTEFKQAENEARENKRGLWGDICNVEEPQQEVETPPETTKTITPVVPSSPSYTCNCSKTCAQMSSCTEAQYQLNVCGCSRRDGDGDGVACDSDCQ
ncbi:MAG: thermonuclease family protein [bacterium]|nr:thermonuclease family protein [bacterium]